MSSDNGLRLVTTRQWWVLTRRCSPYGGGLAATGPFPDQNAAWQELTKQCMATGPDPYDVGYLSESEVQGWTRDVQEGLTPELEDRWERYLTVRFIEAPEDAIPVGAVVGCISPMVGGDRFHVVVFYDGDDVEKVVDKVHRDLGDESEDPFGDVVTCQVVSLLPEGAEVGSDEHKASYQSWLMEER